MENRKKSIIFVSNTFKMISKEELWKIFKEHEEENNVVITPATRKHFIEILYRIDSYEKVKNTKEETSNENIKD